MEQFVSDYSRFDVSPDEVFLDGIDLRNYQITFRRLHGETLEAIGNDFGLTKESIRLIAQKTYGVGIEDAIKAKKKEVLTDFESELDIIRSFIMSHRGIRFYELQVQFPLFDISRTSELGAPAIKFLNLEKENRTNTVVWADQQILGALSKAGTYYFPLARKDYEHLVQVGEIDGPSGALVMQRFGTWALACAKAGVESHKTNLYYTKKWSEREQRDFVIQFLESDFPGTSMANYEIWRTEFNPNATSSQLLRNTFGGWTGVITSALQGLRATWE